MAKAESGNGDLIEKAITELTEISGWRDVDWQIKYLSQKLDFIRKNEARALATRKLLLRIVARGAVVLALGAVVLAVILNINHHKCGEKVKWDFDKATGTLIIKGSGEMSDYSLYATPWEKKREKITSVIIEEGVTSIGNQSFYECRFLQEVSIADSITSIGDYSFADCILLAQVAIPDSVEEIGWGAFSYCENLEELELPDLELIQNSFRSSGIKELKIPASVKEIKNGSFSEMNKLINVDVDVENEQYCTVDGVLFSKDMSVLYSYPAAKEGTRYVVPDSVQEIGDYAFQSCEKLRAVVIPDSVTTIGCSAFENCTELAEVNIPDRLIEIKERTFGDCHSLMDISFPSNVKIIRREAFCWCNTLGSVFIPEGVEAIENEAFSWCTYLMAVELPSTITYIDNDVFAECESLELIFYNGKKKQWDELFDGRELERISNSITLECTDGTYNLN